MCGTLQQPDKRKHAPKPDKRKLPPPVDDGLDDAGDIATPEPDRDDEQRCL